MIPSLFGLHKILNFHILSAIGWPFSRVRTREDILYAEIDLEKAILPKLRHDVAGHYNRFDIMWLSLNRRRQVPISEYPLATGSHGAPEEDSEFIHQLRSIVDDMEDIQIRAQLESLLKKYGY